MKYRCDHDCGFMQEEKYSVGKSTNNCTPEFFVDPLIIARVSCNLGKNLFNA
jgi:hypothetical protein